MSLINITQLSRIMPKDFTVKLTNDFFECPICKVPVSRKKDELQCMTCKNCNSKFSEKLMF